MMDKFTDQFGLWPQRGRSKNNQEPVNRYRHFVKPRLTVQVLEPCLIMVNDFVELNAITPIHLISDRCLSKMKGIMTPVISTTTQTDCGPLLGLRRLANKFVLRVGVVF